MRTETVIGSKKSELEPMPESALCTHESMRECCEGLLGTGCGHFSCDCGITWDEGFDGPWD